MPGQFEGANHSRDTDVLHLQHLHVELGVVGHDEVIHVTDQLFKLCVLVAFLECWFIGNHLFSDVMNKHGVYGNHIAYFADCDHFLKSESSLDQLTF